MAEAINLRLAIQEVFADPATARDYPNGLNGADMLAEIRSRGPGYEFPLVGVLDVVKTLREFWGPGAPGEPPTLH